MKNFLKILSVFLMVFMASGMVYASEIGMADNEIIEEGTYDNLRLIAGNKVVSRAIIDGLSFAAGNDVSLEGSATYGFYAGNGVNISGKIEKDIFVAGNDITVNNNAIITRDAYFAGSSILINANIGRDLRAGGMKVDLSGITIGRDAYIDADEIILDSDTVINGVFSYSENANVIGLELAKIGSVEKRAVSNIDVKIDIKDTILASVVSMLASFITMAVLFYIIPSSKDRLDKMEISFMSFLKYAGLGLIAIIMVPLVCIIGLFTGVLVPLSIITILVYGVSIYLSTLVVSYVIGNLVNRKIFKNENVYLSLIIGIVMMQLLILIPIVRGWIVFISIIYGLGLICKYIVKRT